MRSIFSLQAGVAPGGYVSHLVVKLYGCACAVLFALLWPSLGGEWRTGSLTLAGCFRTLKSSFCGALACWKLLRPPSADISENPSTLILLTGRP